MSQPTFELTLVAQDRGPYDPGGYLRLRMALKTLLRRFSLRCISVKRQKAAKEAKHGQG
jgi:ferredoxin-NADP reductase